MESSKNFKVSNIYSLDRIFNPDITHKSNRKYIQLNWSGMQDEFGYAKVIWSGSKIAYKRKGGIKDV